MLLPIRWLTRMGASLFYPLKGKIARIKYKMHNETDACNFNIKDNKSLCYINTKS